jgi:hypothetical protein
MIPETAAVTPGDTFSIIGRIARARTVDSRKGVTRCHRWLSQVYFAETVPVAFLRRAARRHKHPCNIGVGACAKQPRMPTTSNPPGET